MAMRYTTATLNVAGLWFPALARQPVIKQFVGIYDEANAGLPYIDTNPFFLNQHGVPVNTNTVCVGKERFLVVSYYDPLMAINDAVTNDSTISVPWRGEIVIFGLGQHVFYLARPYRSRASYRKAMGLFIMRFIESAELGTPLPPKLIFGA